MALRFDNGTFGTLTSGYYLDRGKQMYVKIWGSRGWLQMEPESGDALKWYSTNEAKPQVRNYDGPPDDAGYTPYIRACVRACLDMDQPPISPRQSLQVLRTVFACYRAAETNKSQQID